VSTELEEDPTAGDRAAEWPGFGDAVAEAVREDGDRFAETGDEIFEFDAVRSLCQRGLRLGQTRPA
jgi:hypothetical protein